VLGPKKPVPCVKPSGTVSQLADCSSGIHARHSKYYIRTKDEREEHNKQYRKNNKYKIKERQFKKKYKITMSVYMKLLEKQNYKCAICGIHQDNLLRERPLIFHRENQHKFPFLLQDSFSQPDFGLQKFSGTGLLQNRVRL